MTSDYSYFSDSQCSTHTRASLRSTRSFRNKPRTFDRNKRIPKSIYNKPPRPIRNYDTVEQAEVEVSSKLRDFALATSDQTAEQQKLLLENEIAFEDIKTATLIEKTQRAIDHENEINKIAIKKRKADIADNMKLESAKRKFEINNKFIQIETKQKIVEENRTLNDVEVERGLAYVRAGHTPPD